MTSNENGVGLKESGGYSASEAMNARKFRFKDKKDDATQGTESPSIVPNEGVRITLWGDRKIPRMRHGSKTEE